MRCNHIWHFHHTQPGKRAGITTDVSVYICANCSKRRYRSLLGYSRIAGIYRQAEKTTLQYLKDSRAETDEYRKLYLDALTRASEYARG